MNRLVSLFLLFFSFYACSLLASESLNLEDKKIKEMVTAFMEKNNIPGVAVEVYQNGEPHSYYFGYANKEKKTPVTKKTIFELGSLSKIMTSLLLAQQVDFAKVNLNDSIRKFMQTLPDEFDDITLQDLATHTSGFPMDVPKTIKTREDLEKYLTEWKPDQAPEEQWHYSNFGIGMLAIALEIATNKDFSKLYKRYILSPLGMQPIALTVPKRLRPFYAQGYDELGNPVKPEKLGLYPAADGVKASAGDMARFLRAAIGLPGTPERILYPMRMTQAAYVKLSDQMQGLTWEIHSFSKDLNNKIVPESNALGSMVVQEVMDRPLFDGNALIDKTGTTNGFRSYVAVIPNKKSGIVILTNKVVSNAEIVNIGRELLLNQTHTQAKA